MRQNIAQVYYRIHERSVWDGHPICILWYGYLHRNLCIRRLIHGRAIHVNIRKPDRSNICYYLRRNYRNGRAEYGFCQFRAKGWIYLSQIECL